MIHAEHFIHGLFNGIGYRTIKSPGVDALLSDKTFNALCTLTKSTQLLFPVEQCIAVSYVKKTHDEYGREGLYNHTILIKLSDYCAWTQPKKLLDPYFIKNGDKSPERLEPLHIP